MRFTTELNGETLLVHIYHEGIDKEAIYREFSRCRMGTCNRPTSEYSKVDDFIIEDVAPGEIRVKMVPYEGMHFDVAEFTACFESLLKVASRKNPSNK